MKKYLIGFIFIFVFSFVFMNNAFAKNYTFSCGYRGDTDYFEYDVIFEVKGDKISIVEASRGTVTEKNPIELTMKNENWLKGDSCPGKLYLDYTNNNVSLKEDSTKGLLKHYYDWECSYTINYKLDEENIITKLILKYDNAKNKISNIDYSYHADDNGKFPDISFAFKTGKISQEYKIDCNPINVNVEDNKVTITFDDNGQYKGETVKTDIHKEYINGKDGTASTCLDYTTSVACRTDEDVACLWVENKDAPNGGYCNVDNLLYVGCGGASDIPMQVPSLISLLVNLLKIATPIILIFISIITLLKAMSAGKEDEIKKATSSLVKKIIAAALVFFVIGIVQFVMSKVAEDDDYNGITDCFNCFLNNDCKVNTYYKTVVDGEDKCTYLTTGETKDCKDFK